MVCKILPFCVTHLTAQAGRFDKADKFRDSQVLDAHIKTKGQEVDPANSQPKITEEGSLPLVVSLPECQTTPSQVRVENGIVKHPNKLLTEKSVILFWWEDPHYHFDVEVFIK